MANPTTQHRPAPLVSVSIIRHDSTKKPRRSGAKSLQNGPTGHARAFALERHGMGPEWRREYARPQIGDMLDLCGGARLVLAEALAAVRHPNGRYSEERCGAAAFTAIPCGAGAAELTQQVQLARSRGARGLAQEIFLSKHETG